MHNNLSARYCLPSRKYRQYHTHSFLRCFFMDNWTSSSVLPFVWFRVRRYFWNRGRGFWGAIRHHSYDKRGECANNYYSQRIIQRMRSRWNLAVYTWFTDSQDSLHGWIQLCGRLLPNLRGLHCSSLGRSHGKLQPRSPVRSALSLQANSIILWIFLISHHSILPREGFFVLSGFSTSLWNGV